MSNTKILRDGEGGMVNFWCPGCQSAHSIAKQGNTHGYPAWTITGTDDKPTVSPSVLVRSGNEKGDTVCHSFIRDGQIEFLSDCTHELASRTVPLEAW